MPAAPRRRPALERAAYWSLLACAASTQFSIAAAQIFLALTAVLWIALLVLGRERIEVPGMFWPLAVYAGATLAASLFSIDPRVSFLDSRQLLLFLLVPMAYRLLRGERSLQAVDVIITVGAVHAVYGIVQYGILNADDTPMLAQRVQGLLSHYMTYSGLIMLVACTAAARLLFRRDARLWAGLIMPALLVVLVLTASRNAWVGACAGIGLLLLLRDFRLIGLVPVVIGLFIALAPAPIADRFYAMFSVQDLVDSSETSTATAESNRDRVAMIRSGVRIIRDHPLTGVGPDILIRVYPMYRDPRAVRPLNPHLHNVPIQIAAERGLPALGIWLWFVVTLIRDFARARKTTAYPSIAAAGLASTVAMLAAGMFEYNFHDSEFLMLFLVLVTLPYAAARTMPHGSAVKPATAA